MQERAGEEQRESEAAGRQIREGGKTDRAKAWRRVERRQGEMQRREDQRLRIGDLRPARKQVWGPERRFAPGERRRRGLQDGLGLGLWIPRGRGGARQAPPRQGRERSGRE